MRDDVLRLLAEDWGVDEQQLRDVAARHQSIRQRIERLPDERVDLPQLHSDVKAALIGEF